MLITGESGTGKEFLARYVHGRSSRAKSIHLSQLRRNPGELAGIELFGHARNKLNEYANDGVPIPPPGSGEVRGAA